MGKGGHNTDIKNNDGQQLEATSLSTLSHGLPTLPHGLPKLTDIKVKLPDHCFRPTIRQSMSYVVKDIIYVTLTFIIMYQIQTKFNYGFLLFPIYWCVQGTLYTSLFVLGHDCGHGSFSSNQLLNDIVGTILHTWILAPYYTWKLSHNKHHKNTANIDKDEVFYPQRGAHYEHSVWDDILFWLPGIGWFYYLINGYSPRPINHFNPFEPLFYDRHFFGVCCSLAAYSGMCYLMFLYACSFGFINLLVYHLIPVFIFACYMVIITLLHHTEIGIPWYADSEWNNVKGQLSTVDRNYGSVHSIIHSIGTHQIHHLFTKVPHYHLEEATTQFRIAYPELVRYSDESVLSAFARMFKIFVRQRGIGEDVKVFAYTEDGTINNKQKIHNE
jgi:omega-3 fatty acid desaturase (delta-15 desaturase)